ncbi:MAG: CDP-alcohol phosphatidyltransferase family protein [Maritimibacter sp.]
MIDAVIQPLQRRVLTPPARLLVARGVHADQVTLAGFGVGLLAVVALGFGGFSLALVLLGLNRLADGLDGAIARETGATDRGAFLDIALDFIFYALFPLGFALHDPSNALPAAILIAAFVGTGSSFLAFATIAAKRGESSEAYPSKGIYYLGGLTEGFETIAIFAAMCLWPAAFPALAYIFALACLITTVTRWYWGWVAFAPDKA